MDDSSVYKAEAAVAAFLSALGEDPAREGLRDTPARVTAAWREFFSGMAVDPKSVLATSFDENHDELVLVRDIDFFSICEHHLLPFRGRAHVGYIPGNDGRITGLSSLARLVEVLSRRPQVQERLTTQIAETLVEQLQPRGVIVVLDAEHLCMSLRGVRNSSARAVTSAVRGWFQTSAAARSEAMSLIQGSS